MSTATRASVDLGALRHNLAQARRHAAGARVMAAIKADAYGHGLIRAALALAAADALAVARPSEGLALRRAGIATPIVVLDGVLDAEELRACAGEALDVVVHRSAQLELLRGLDASRPLGVWLKVDSGMHRLGVAPAEAAALHHALSVLPAVRGPVGMMTHLAEADAAEAQPTQRQYECFSAALTGCAGPRSLANSAALLRWPWTHADWVRPGIMLYGISPFAQQTGASLRLQAAMRLTGTLIEVRTLAAGEAVGYGAAWRAPAQTMLGVIATGYGDGYPRHAPSGTPVWLNGRRVSLAGRVSMDLITVDLGPGATDRPGDTAELWGPQQPVEEVAAAAGTIGYELVCGVTRRTTVTVET